MKRETKRLKFDNLIAFMDTFRDDRTCLEHYFHMRWPDGVECPYCNSKEVYILSQSYRYKCSNTKCKKMFRLTTGTIFQDSRISLRQWFIGLFLLTTNKKGYSSHQLARYLNISQKAAWHMGHRIRKALKESEVMVYDGVIEMDEALFGPLNKYMHTSRRPKGNQGYSLKSKDAIIGIMKRGVGIILEIESEKLDMDRMNAIIAKHVKPFSIILTDESHLYNSVNVNYFHGRTNHRKKEYVNWNFPIIHTNSIECFWALLKRSFKGVYQRPSRKHLRLYCDEIQFRFNTRQMSDTDRFNLVLQKPPVQLTYRDLTSNAA